MHLLSAKGMHARVLRDAPDGGLDLNVLRQALHAKDRRKKRSPAPGAASRLDGGARERSSPW